MHYQMIDNLKTSILNLYNLYFNKKFQGFVISRKMFHNIFYWAEAK